MQFKHKISLEKYLDKKSYKECFPKTPYNYTAIEHCVNVNEINNLCKVKIPEINSLELMEEFMACTIEERKKINL